MPSSPQASTKVDSAFPPVSVAPRQVRVPAVRDGHTYGWIQLPRGTAVDLVRVEGNDFVVRYDETVVRLPQSEAREGSVIVRSKKPRFREI